MVTAETRSEAGSPGAGITGGCELGCWEPSTGPLKEQQPLLTAEPSL